MIKTNAMRLLEGEKIPFICFEYRPQTGVDALSVAGYLKKDPKTIFKTLVVISPEHECFVCVVPATSELDLKKAAKAAGVKSLEMLPLKKLFPTTGYIHGGCSPVGMKKQFQTFIDVSACSLPTFCISGGKVGLTLEVSPKVLADFLKAKFVPLGHSHD